MEEGLEPISRPPPGKAEEALVERLLIHGDLLLGLLLGLRGDLAELLGAVGGRIPGAVRASDGAPPQCARSGRTPRGCTLRRRRRGGGRRSTGSSSTSGGGRRRPRPHRRRRGQMARLGQPHPAILPPSCASLRRARAATAVSWRPPWRRLCARRVAETSGGLQPKDLSWAFRLESKWAALLLFRVCLKSGLLSVFLGHRFCLGIGLNWNHFLELVCLGILLQSRIRIDISAFQAMSRILGLSGLKYAVAR